MSQAALNRGSEKRGRVSAERLAGAWGEGPGGSARARPRVETRAGAGGSGGLGRSCEGSLPVLAAALLVEHFRFQCSASPRHSILTAGLQPSAVL